MQKIIPGILEFNLDEIKREFDLVKDECELIQIDLCDGVFVEHKTWPFNEAEPYEKLLDLLPFSHNIQLDVMAKVPNTGLIFRLNPKAIVFHVDAFDQEFLDLFRKFETETSEKKESVGFAFSSDFGMNENFRELISKCDFVQVMGIKEIGKQHEPFDATCLETIKKLRNEFPDLLIQVDGGMNEQTIPQVLAVGASRVVVGSALFGNADTLENLKKLDH